MSLFCLSARGVSRLKKLPHMPSSVEDIHLLWFQSPLGLRLAKTGNDEIMEWLHSFIQDEPLEAVEIFMHYCSWNMVS